MNPKIIIYESKKFQIEIYENKSYCDVLIKETGEIKRFEAFKFPGTYGQQKLRTLRRAINFIIKYEGVISWKIKNQVL